MELFQLLVFFSTVSTAAFGNRRWLYGIAGFWLLWTLIYVFAPWLIALQLTVLTVAFWIALKLIDRLELRRVAREAEPSPTAQLGNIYLIQTSPLSLGAMDFKRILSLHGVKLSGEVRMFGRYGEAALAKAIAALEAKLSHGDVVAIVRGGGDIASRQFDAFRSSQSCRKICELQNDRGVVFVTGIGHEPNRFPVDEQADFSAITPTHAAFQIVEWVRSSAKTSGWRLSSDSVPLAPPNKGDAADTKTCPRICFRKFAARFRRS